MNYIFFAFIIILGFIFFKNMDSIENFPKIDLECHGTLNFNNEPPTKIKLTLCDINTEVQIC